MKKIVSILFVALIALAFMGCPTQFEDLEFPTIVDCYIVGAPNFKAPDNVFELMKDNGDSTCSYEFTYKTAMSSNWGSPSDGICFKVTDGDGSWTALYANSALTVGGGYVPSEKGDGKDGNASVSGLTDSTTYVITVNYGVKPFQAKIDAK